MDFVKSHWIGDGEKVKLTVPIAKIDEERRLVSGFATLDNVDKTDDVVLASASAEAFAAWPGNIREMHQPIAAGTLFNFAQDSFYDSESQKFYNGIYVTVYVSKGAPLTWEKVLDGTLSGFSIGGNILESHEEYVPDLGRTVRFITKYQLVELSLVDNPANQFANIFSVQKDEAGALMVKGMIMETEIKNIHWCETDRIAKCTTEDSESCTICGTPMSKIDWIESGEDDIAAMQEVINKHLRLKEESPEVEISSDQVSTVVATPDEIRAEEGMISIAGDGTISIGTIANNEGGVTMTDEVTKSEEVKPTTEEVVAEVSTETETEAPAPAEVAAEPDFAKMFEDLKASFEKSLEEMKAGLEATVKGLNESLAEVTKSLEEDHAKVEELGKTLNEELNDIKKSSETVEGRIEAIEKSSAVKKSGEVETTEPEVKQKGLWAGAFFNE